MIHQGHDLNAVSNVKIYETAHFSSFYIQLHGENSSKICDSAWTASKPCPCNTSTMKVCCMFPCPITIKLCCMFPHPISNRIFDLT